jgi:hypothetical protein
MQGHDGIDGRISSSCGLLVGVDSAPRPRIQAESTQRLGRVSCWRDSKYMYGFRSGTNAYRLGYEVSGRSSREGVQSRTKPLGTAL